MTIWTPRLKHRSGPRYKAIAEAIGEAVSDGALAPGARLPTHRDLAYRLGLTVGTVSRAYGEAMKRGLVHGEVGRGTFVGRADEPEAPDLGIFSAGKTQINFHINCPTKVDDETYRQALMDIASNPKFDQLTGWRAEQGSRSHRLAMLQFIERLGWRPDIDNIVLCSGAQNGVLVALAATCRPGDVLLVESLTFPGVFAAAAMLGLRVEPVALDREGVIPEALEEAILRHRPKALICVPRLHNPTAAVMSEERLDAIAGIALRHGLSIIEDDVYGYTQDAPLAPLVSRIPEQGLFITSVSKTLMATLRAGCLVVPRHLVEAVANAVRTCNWVAPPLDVEVATRWITSGGLERQINGRKIELARAHAAFAQAFDGFDWHLPNGAFSAWLTLPEGWSPAAAVAAAGRANILLAPTEVFVCPGVEVPNAIRVSLVAPDAAHVKPGLEALAALLRTRSQPRLSVI